MDDDRTDDAARWAADGGPGAAQPPATPDLRSPVPHQLQLPRALGLVTGRRDGRRIHRLHDLYDAHVAQLIDQAVHRVEHLRLGMRGPG